MLTSLYPLFYVTGECYRFLHRGRLRVVPLSLCPSCVTRTKTARKKWLREILGVRSTRKEGLPPKPKSLPFHGRVIFWCRISYLDELMSSHYRLLSIATGDVLNRIALLLFK